MKRINNKIIISSSIMYVLVLIAVFSESLQKFIMPGHLSNRVTEIYNSPELISIFFLICLMFSYPLIVIGTLYNLLVKIEKIEKLIN